MEIGVDVIIAASGRPLEFLKREFPSLQVIHFPGTKIFYPTQTGMAFFMLLRIPRILWGFRKEHRELTKIIREYHIEAVVSDNRYGCWNKDILSIFITHQLEIQLPKGIQFLAGILRYINFWFIKKYHECWIPDFEQLHGLAGDLSHPVRLPDNCRYIGILSRFTRNLLGEESAILPIYDVLVILSGPEPQRAILEEKIMSQLLRTHIQAILVRGIPETTSMKLIDDHIQVYDHLESTHLQKLMQQSMLIISRSGYSSIMDLVTLGKRAILIPTPGQTEQEYLASYLMHKKIFFSQKQDNFDLVYAIEMTRNYPGMVIENDYKDIEERIRYFFA
jgi:UDP:flavonoid glycosyltransferase YjiC (YdhE family)